MDRQKYEEIVGARRGGGRMGVLTDAELNEVRNYRPPEWEQFNSGDGQPDTTDNWGGTNS